MTKVSAVIAENRDNPDRLLLIGDDDQHYQYQLPEGITTPTDPDDTWVNDPRSQEVETLLGEVERLTTQEGAGHRR